MDAPLEVSGKPGGEGPLDCLLAEPGGAQSDADPAGPGPWPPGPDEIEHWRFVLDRWPWLAPALDGTEAAQPAVRELADGLAGVLEHRVDALRACGNGVVPLTAAAAFLQLFAVAVLNPDSTTQEFPWSN